MKVAIGLTMAFMIGFLCRYFNIPLPAPPNLIGALLVLCVTFGFMCGDYFFK